MKTSSVLCKILLGSALSVLAKTNEPVVASIGGDDETSQVPLSAEISVVVSNVVPNFTSDECNGKQIDWLARRVEKTEKNLADCYEGLKEHICTKIDDGINKAEEEYKERYAELKDEQNRFLSKQQIVIGAIAVLTTLVGIAIPFLSRLNLKLTEKKFGSEWGDLRRQIESQFKKDQHVSRAEMFFQIARTSYEHYKTIQKATVLDGTVKALSHCIESNVLAEDGDCLIRAISFLNIVMEKDVDAKEPYAAALIRDRPIVKKQLKTWTCRASLSEMMRVMKNSRIDQAIIDASFNTLRNVFGRFGATSEID